MHTKKQFLKHLKENTRVLENSLVEKAFKNIDRKDFVPEEYISEAYEDYPLPIGYGQTISQPTTVAFMLDKLNPQQGNRVLDIGSGSGWTTALLADIVGSHGEVIGLERITELVSFGQKNLAKYSYKNARIEQAGSSFGLSGSRAFDRILVSAAAHGEVPQELIDQLKPLGNMIIPVDESIVEVNKRKDGIVEQRAHVGFAFVPLVSDN